MTLYSPQIIKTLQDQVQNMLPLRDSFRRLEKYYLQLTHDFDQLLTESEQSEKELFTNLKYLEEIHRSLQREFGGCGQELRDLECEHARVQMEQNQQLAQAEALKSRQVLEEEQKRTLQDKRKDLIEQNEKLSFTIAKYKEMLHNLELAIKSKEYENLDIEREIKKLEMVNQKINQLNKEAETSIDQVQKNNQDAVEEIYNLESKLATYDKLIDVKEKQNKESVQCVIAKTEDLEQLKHRKEYVEKLIESELAEQKELTKTNGELESILAAKREKLMFIDKENSEYARMIEEEKEKKAQSKDEHLKLKIYLQTLAATNEQLYRELEKCCAQDREVQILLSDKLERLLVMNDRIVENDLLNKPSPSSANPRIFKQRNLPSPKLPLKQFTSFNSKEIRAQSFNGQGTAIDKLNFLRTQEMNSTWGSHAKQNFVADV